MKHAMTFGVDAPPNRVWSVISDVEHWSDWTTSIRSVRLLDGGPLRVGSVARVEQPKLPPAVWEVVSIEDTSRYHDFTWKAGAPGMRSVASHTVVPRPDGGSTVTLSIETTGVLGWLVSPLLGGITRRYVAMEAAGLKATTERTS